MVEWLAWLCRVEEGLGESSSSVSSLSNGTSFAPVQNQQTVNGSSFWKYDSAKSENYKYKQTCRLFCHFQRGMRDRYVELLTRGSGRRDDCGLWYTLSEVAEQTHHKVSLKCWTWASEWPGVTHRITGEDPGLLRSAFQEHSWQKPLTTFFGGIRKSRFNSLFYCRSSWCIYWPSLKSWHGSNADDPGWADGDAGLHCRLILDVQQTDLQRKHRRSISQSVSTLRPWPRLWSVFIFTSGSLW